MKYTKNYNMNLPELADQYNLSRWNENAEKTDTQMKVNENAIGAESRRATQKENDLSSAISNEVSRATQKEETLSSAITSETSRATQKENTINEDLTSHKNNKSNPHEVSKSQVGLGNVDNKSFKTMAQALFDMEHPVGEKGRIVQWPWDDEPKVKYNNNLITSDWKIVTEYDGKFFKIDSKKNVGIFTEESLPNIKGSVYNLAASDNGYAQNLGWRDASGCFYSDQNLTAGAYRLSSNTIHMNKRLNIDLHNVYNKEGNIISTTVYKDGAKVQPDNISIKVWERTK